MCYPHMHPEKVIFSAFAGKLEYNYYPPQQKLSKRLITFIINVNDKMHSSAFGNVNTYKVPVFIDKFLPLFGYTCIAYKYIETVTYYKMHIINWQ